VKEKSLSSYSTGCISTSSTHDRSGNYGLRERGVTEWILSGIFAASDVSERLVLWRLLLE